MYCTVDKEIGFFSRLYEMRSGCEKISAVVGSAEVT